MSRHSSALVAQRQAGLLQRRRELKAEHPVWGYRRMCASLHVVERRPVNKQRMWRLMRQHHLLVPPPALESQAPTKGEETSTDQAP